jgi:hypothetical protein
VARIGIGFGFIEAETRGYAAGHFHRQVDEARQDAAPVTAWSVAKALGGCQGLRANRAAYQSLVP